MEDGTGCAEGEENQWHGNIGMQFHVGYFARSVTLIYKQYACDPYVFTLLGWLTHSRGKKIFAIFVKQQYIPVSVFHACCILTNKSIIELSLANKLAQISRRDLSSKFQFWIFVKNQKSIIRKLLVTQERSLLNFNINQFRTFLQYNRKKRIYLISRKKQFYYKQKLETHLFDSYDICNKSYRQKLFPLPYIINKRKGKRKRKKKRRITRILIKNRSSK